MANVKFTDLPNLGNITANTIVPVVDANVNYTVTAANLQAYVNSNAGQITANSVSATGNIVAGAFFVGDGSQLTNLPQLYGNANVAAFVANLGANAVSTTGNVTANYFVGNGSLLTGLPATYGNAEVAAYLPTYTGNLNPNTVSATGNVTGAFLFGNISGATGGYGNSNVQAVLQTYTGTLTAGSLSTTGNITGNFFVGNGSQLTGITASLSGNLAGNINGNGFSITNLLNVSATGNISGTHFGSGANLTGIPTSIIAGTGISVSAATGAVTITNNNPTPYANANVAAYLPTYSGAITASSVSATGNITAANITGAHFGNGGALSNVVTSIIAGTGISINQSTGAVTITNTGGGGSGDSISNGTTNIRISGVNGNILANVGSFANVANICQTSFTYPLINLRGGINVNSQAGGHNPALPFDGGISTDGSIVALGNIVVNGYGLYGTLRGDINTLSSATVGSLSSSGTIQMTGASGASGNINAGGGRFKINQTTITQGTVGSPGEMTWDANYIYVCTAANTWKRAALTTF